MKVYVVIQIANDDATGGIYTSISDVFDSYKAAKHFITNEKNLKMTDEWNSEYEEINCYPCHYSIKEHNLKGQ